MRTVLFVYTKVLSVCNHVYDLEAQKLATKVKTPIDDLFGGAVLNTVICRECLEVTTIIVN